MRAGTAAVARKAAAALGVQIAAKTLGASKDGQQQYQSIVKPLLPNQGHRVPGRRCPMFGDGQVAGAAGGVLGIRRSPMGGLPVCGAVR